jgi:Fe-S-cluster-containing dehydrogenase component
VSEGRTRIRLPLIDQPEREPALDVATELAVEAEHHAQLGRRAFMAAAGTGAAALAAGCSSGAYESFLQQHFRRLDEDERAALLASLEQRAEAEHGVEVSIAAPEAIEGVEYGYALDLSVCTGCRQCEYACASENNTSRDPQLHYIHVLELDAGTLDPEQSTQLYDGEVPADRKVYMPVSCMQCANPPCVSACPVNATWTESDGITVVDYDWCIGCRYCEAACPYGARHFNFADPSLAPSEINPDQGYLSNRVRPRGAMEKCHFCLHRVRRGQLPACQEACPVGARHFGDMRDPTSSVRRILETKRVFVLREELGTRPRFFYFFG